MLLVVGNAATADGLVRVNETPASHDVGHIVALANRREFWMPGGSAPAIALAASAHAPVRLWHPLPVAEATPSARELHASFEKSGVDVSYCPAIQDDIRALLIEAPGARFAWSEEGTGLVPDNVAQLLDGVTHVIFAPRWGIWSDLVLAEASGRGLGCSIVGEIPDLDTRWDYVIADQRQVASARDLSVSVVVQTLGAEGARIAPEGAESIRIDAVPASVVDTTGAGDVFGGTFIAAAVTGYALDRAGALAAQAASRQCEKWGALPHSIQEKKDEK
ncbi:carbohydrate kinase family protein [Arthrobacter sp. Soil762]|uniref:carbohydrate kinase family protein n=1 Tax=Arthrobacter sp. Soil762 TaxID=1736401 RepID=UPI0006FC9CC3|nr:carbohydrate kinase family protein [Arthrobacter sp. Soil762]KRE72726.1 hypothetical protein ASG77_08665 [Arthrobacter sp. Soil762]